MTVAVAHSATPRGKAALRAAAEEAVRRGETLAVLRIVGGVDTPREDPDYKAAVEAELLGFPALTWRVHSAPEGTDTAVAILDLADELDASVLVIGSRRRRPIGKLILGSTVQRVLLESLIPVLVVKAP